MKKTLCVICIICFCNVQSNAQLPNNISAADKVYGLSKFWQEVNYNFIYLEKIDRKNWENAYKGAIETVQKRPMIMSIIGYCKNFVHCCMMDIQMFTCHQIKLLAQ